MHPAGNRELVRNWCAKRFGSQPRQVLFESDHLSTVIGFELGDGRRVVVKARPANNRVLDCVAVQRHLAERGYPCARPLTAVELTEGLAVNAEEYKPLGEQLIHHPSRPALFAAALAWMIQEAPPTEEMPALSEPPPWVGWNHRQDGLWPIPDDTSVDLNECPGPSWLDHIAQLTRERLRSEHGPAVIRHGDWESQNMRWVGSQLYCVHDWDSLVIHTEPALAGAAAAVYTATGAPDTSPSVEETEQFLDAYVRARAVEWDREELEVAWAAGLWVRVFNAKKDWIQRGSLAVEELRPELEERMVRTGQ